MNYKDIFRPETLQKLDKESAENLRQMLGDKNLKQTLQSSMGLLNQVIEMEEPYKAQLEELAIQMVEDMYPIIHEDDINIDAKIVGMDEINQSLDEIKISKPSSKELIKNKRYNVYDTYNNVYKDVFFKGIDKHNLYVFIDHNIGNTIKILKTNIKNSELSEIKVTQPNKFRIQYFADSYPYKEPEIVQGSLNQIKNKIFKELNNVNDNQYTYWTTISKPDTEDPRWDWKEIGRIKKTEGEYQYSPTYFNENILQENTPESKRRVINGITQGAALRGTFSFYLFKEYLDVINPELVEKYNQLMKEIFGIYDDPNAIAMFLQTIAMGQKIGGGSSKVIINEQNNLNESLFNKLYKGAQVRFSDNKVLWFKNNINGNEGFFTGDQGIGSYRKKYKNIESIDGRKLNNYKKSINEQEQKGITIKARALCFPMLVHEIIKGLYELVSLQGFQGTKDQNQTVVDKVDKLEHEPEDIKYGKLIFDALNDIFANSDYNDPRIREYFFAEVYQLGDREFVEFIEDAINDELTQSEKHWIQQTLKEISFDLKNDDFDNTGLDEIKINKPSTIIKFPLEIKSQKQWKEIISKLKSLGYKTGHGELEPEMWNIPTILDYDNNYRNQPERKILNYYIKS